MTENYERATFAGGCFWCLVKPFDELRGFRKGVSGYIGGWKEHPTYEEVCTGRTGHSEAGQIIDDPAFIQYRDWLALYWTLIDPTDPDGQFYDRGSQYRTAIFYHNESRRILAEQIKKELENCGRFSGPIVAEILPASILQKKRTNIITTKILPDMRDIFPDLAGRHSWNATGGNGNREREILTPFQVSFRQNRRDPCAK